MAMTPEEINVLINTLAPIINDAVTSVEARVTNLETALDSWSADVNRAISEVSAGLGAMQAADGPLAVSGEAWRRFITEEAKRLGVKPVELRTKERES